jgi:hypothetical protein
MTLAFADDEEPYPCWRQVREAQVLIVILGRRYTGEPAPVSAVPSYTELEFLETHNAGDSTSAEQIARLRQLLVEKATAGTLAPGTDVVVWTREVCQGLVAYGGPVLLFEVVVIVWFLAAQVSPDARQQVSELAGIFALALALAPGFKTAAERFSSRKNDAAK